MGVDTRYKMGIKNWRMWQLSLIDAQMKELEYKKKEAKALCLIQQGVANTIFPIIINATKAKEAWDMMVLDPC